MVLSVFPCVPRYSCEPRRQRQAAAARRRLQHDKKRAGVIVAAAAVGSSWGAGRAGEGLQAIGLARRVGVRLRPSPVESTLRGLACAAILPPVFWYLWNRYRLLHRCFRGLNESLWSRLAWHCYRCWPWLVSWSPTPEASERTSGWACRLARFCRLQAIAARRAG